jgi:surfeit locus 1 family protein
MTPRGRSLLFFAISVVFAAVFTGLGFWQLSRREARRALNAEALAARERPPLDLDDPVQAAELRSEKVDDQRVAVTGRYDHAAEVVLRGQIVRGVPGVRLVTPLRPFRGDTAILVQRGYLPSPDAQSVNPSEFVEDGVQRVVGLAFRLPASGVEGQPLEKDGVVSWRRLDLAALRARLPYPLADFYILQVPDSSLPRLPRRDEPPALSEGPHLNYAIQWFSFAAIALVGGYIVGFRRRP